MNVDYYLVSAARRAHRLRTGRNYSFGREDGVDILLQDALASRRHAEMRWIDNGWSVADLASRNGVLVNGKRITALTPMGDGDQLQIGGQIFRLYLLPPGSDPASLSNQAPQISNLETMGPGFSLNDLQQASATFTGVVTAGGVMELLQFFQVTAKSGRLDLLDGKAPGSVFLIQGTPTHATSGEHTGIDGLLELAVNPPPRFSFHADAIPNGERTLEGSANGILMELARMMDEKRK
jgi:pSer/pThr/pTyr-binding forkhead associated (FHA) protein